MAGLYIHIPFCKCRCLYCDFFSTTQLARREEYVDAIVKEIQIRKEEAGEPFRTIYLGGGTPSTLDIKDIKRILQNTGIEDKEEITMELNPGDASPDYLHELREMGINRLSIGIQSFNDELLQTIGRRHNAAQALEAITEAHEAGFENISIDLIYALPGQTMKMWDEDITTALRHNVQHISCYGLMYEPNTEITRKLEKGLIKAIDEDTEIAMYDYLCERLKKAGYIHYEVSNFALPGHEAKHNSSYWDGSSYIGIGAGAHSYIGHTRSWNPDNLEEYIQTLLAHDLQSQRKENNIYSAVEKLAQWREKEILTETEQYNEQIMLGLRTNKGVPLSKISPDKAEKIQTLMTKKLLIKTPSNRIIATQRGLHILNQIIEELMIED